MLAPFASGCKQFKARIDLRAGLVLNIDPVAQILSKHGSGQGRSPSGIAGFIPVAGLDAEQNAERNDQQLEQRSRPIALAQERNDAAPPCH